VDLEGDVLGELGISVARPKPVLGKIMEGGAAQRAGLQAGDLITSIEGQPVPDGIAFIEAIRSAGAHPLTVGVMRDGRALTLRVTPELEPGAQHARIKAEVALMPEMVKVQSGPFEALAKGAGKTWDIGATSLRMVGKMIVGEVSWKNVTGPITIADYAGQSARSGVASFLAFIAFISISLGVMNLLPIPVLDGGLLLYYSLEVLTGRPLPERVGALAQRFGVGLLLMLMALAVFNDVARLL
ncbi:MAG: RIP metalloprotease RseP, partial [Telluria sp.]